MKKFIFITTILTIALVITFNAKIKKTQSLNPEIKTEEIKEKIEIKPSLPNISTVIPTYLDYTEIITQIQKWHQEAPNLTEFGYYGKTKHNTNIGYIRICNNKNTKKDLPKVLITACIHGNEPLATGCIMDS